MKDIETQKEILKIKTQREIHKIRSLSEDNSEKWNKDCHPISLGLFHFTPQIITDYFFSLNGADDPDSFIKCESGVILKSIKNDFLHETVYNAVSKSVIIDKTPYLEQYSDGFIEGYNLFSKACIGLPIDLTNANFIHKVFKRLFDSKGEIDYYYQPAYPTGEIIGINVSKINLTDYIKVKTTSLPKIKFDGVNGGEYYRCWEIILENPSLFEPYFNKYVSAQINQSEFPTINTNVYDSDRIYEKFQNHFFKCSLEDFNNWLVKGIRSNNCISINKGTSKAMLFHLLYLIMNDTKKVNNKYFKTVFNLDFKLGQDFKFIATEAHEKTKEIRQKFHNNMNDLNYCKK